MLIDSIAVQALFAPELWPPDEQRLLLREHLDSFERASTPTRRRR